VSHNIAHIRKRGITNYEYVIAPHEWVNVMTLTQASMTKVDKFLSVKMGDYLLDDVKPRQVHPGTGLVPS
jgi:hypothetical protein